MSNRAFSWSGVSIIPHIICRAYAVSSCSFRSWLYIWSSVIKQYYKFYEKEIPDQRQFDDRGTETFPSPAVVTKKSDEGQINQEGIIVT